jgi:deoxyribonuclease V
MELPETPNSWTVTPKEAVEIQRRLAGSVSAIPLAKRPRFVAGVDCAFSDDRCFSAAVVWDLEERSAIETKATSRRLEFPYVPGLLSFREIPVILDVLKLLPAIPDVLMCDGQGYAHPRRFGLASHLGVVTGIPSCGCAKSRLIGTYEEPAPMRGSSAELRDGDELIGKVVRTRDRVKPLFVSIGHRITLDEAVELVLACGAGLRLPEPTRLADLRVGEYKRTQLAGALCDGDDPCGETGD